MEIYRCQTPAQDVRSTKRTSYSEFITTFSSSKPRFIREENILRFGEDCFFVTKPLVQRLIAQTLDLLNDRRIKTEQAAYDIFLDEWNTFKFMVINTLETARASAPEANYVSPIILWTVFEKQTYQYLALCLFDGNEADALNHYFSFFGVNRTSNACKDVALLPLQNIDGKSLFDISYTILWKSKPIGLATRHYYDTFNIEHYHEFFDFETLDHYKDLCLYNYYVDHIRSTENSIPPKRLLTYPNVLPYMRDNDIRRLLSLYPPPTYNLSTIPTNRKQFRSMYMKHFEMISASGHMVRLPNADSRITYYADYMGIALVNAFDATLRVRSVLMPLRVPHVVADTMSSEVNVQATDMGPIVDWPMGDKLPRRNTYTLEDDIGNFISRNHLPSISPDGIFSTQPVVLPYDVTKDSPNSIKKYIAAFMNDDFSGPNNANLLKHDEEFLSIYSFTQPSRRISSDNFGKALSPDNLVKQGWEDITRSVTLSPIQQMIYFSYVYDVALPVEINSGVVSVGPVNGTPSEIYNSSTLKLLSVTLKAIYALVTVERATNLDVAMIAKYSSKQNITVLGAIEEPLRQKLRNISRGNWNVIGLGLDARSPNFNADFKNVVASHSSSWVISDMNATTTRDVGSLCRWLHTTLVKILSARPALLIFKLQWPLLSFYEYIEEAAGDEYSWLIARSGASPPNSTEIFLIFLNKMDRDPVIQSPTFSQWATQFATMSTNDSGVILRNYSSFRSVIKPQPSNVFTTAIPHHVLGPIAVRGFAPNTNDAISIVASHCDYTHVFGANAGSDQDVVAVGYMARARSKFYSSARPRRLLNSDGTRREYKGITSTDRKVNLRNTNCPIFFHDVFVEFVSIVSDDENGVLYSFGCGAMPDLGFTDGLYVGYDRSSYPGIFTNKPPGTGTVEVQITDETTFDVGIGAALPPISTDEKAIYTMLDSLTMEERVIDHEDISNMLINFCTAMKSKQTLIFSIYRGKLDTLLRIDYPDDGSDAQPAVVDLRTEWLAANSRISCDVTTPAAYFSFGSYEPVPYYDTEKFNALVTALEALGTLDEYKQEFLISSDIGLSRGFSLPSSYNIASQAIASVYGIFRFVRA